MKVKGKKGGRTTKVQKMLSPEEEAMLSNIQSIVGELVSLNSGGGDMSGEDDIGGEQINLAETEPYEEEDETEGKEVKMIIKGIETTQSDSSTASDNTEERMSEVQTEQTEQNVQEVVKALLSNPDTAKALLGNAFGFEIKKSAPKQSVDPAVQVMSQMAQIQKNQNSRMDEMTDVMKNLLEGLGIVDQMKVTKAKNITPTNQANTAQNEQILQVIQKALGIPSQNQETEQVNKSNSQAVHKTFAQANVLAGLLGRRVNTV
jgi:hypothetical protein